MVLSLAPRTQRQLGEPQLWRTSVALGRSKEASEVLGPAPSHPWTLCTLQLSGPLLPCVHRLGTGGDREEGSQVLFLLKDPPALRLEAGAICD